MTPPKGLRYSERKLWETADPATRTVLARLARIRGRSDWQPFSQRTASRFSRARFGWWVRGLRTRLALRIAPWFTNAWENAHERTSR